MGKSTNSKPRRPRGSLTPDVILDAAERVAEQGSDALTMRALAADLGSAPMALYRHFPTKEALLNALLDRVLGRFEPPAVSDDWRADLRAFTLAHRRVLSDHPWAVTELFDHPNPGPNAGRIGEVALEILSRAGCSREQAVATFSGLLALNYGWASFATARAADPTDGAAVRATLASLPPSLFPHTIAVATEMGDYASDRHYAIALDQMLAGITPRD